MSKITLVLCLCLSLALFECILAAPSQFVPLIALSEAKHITHLDSDASFEQLWESYKVLTEKTYLSEDEESRRKEIFRDNLKKITFHNYLADKGLKSFHMGINKFTDMDTKEFTAVMNGFRRSANFTRQGATYLSPNIPITLAKDVDWRDKGYVTPVKNQGQCGSCWAFSSTGSLEGQTMRKTGKLVSLSESNLVDCSKKWGNDGCNGGLMDNAFTYIKDNKGLDTEQSYPYVAKEQTCHFQKKNVGGTDVGFTDIPAGDEDALQEAVATIGPISVAIDASQSSFQMYSTGIYDEPECSSSQLDHGVLVVGYGTEDGKDFWLVKNSWGEEWGLKGYIKMSRNKDNQCGIASMASYPNV